MYSNEQLNPLGLVSFIKLRMAKHLLHQSSIYDLIRWHHSPNADIPLCPKIHSEETVGQARLKRFSCGNSREYENTL